MKVIQTAAELSAHLVKTQDDAELVAEELALLKSKVKSMEAGYSAVSRGAKDAFMAGGSWRGSTAEADERIGKIIKGVIGQNSEGLADLGVYPGRIDKDSGLRDRQMGKDGGRLLKADEGSPWVGGSTPGSYLIPIQYLRDVAFLAEDVSELQPLVTTYQMTTRTAKMPRHITGAVFVRQNSDTADISESVPDIDDITLNAYPYGRWLTFSEDVQDDSYINVGQYVRQVFNQAYTVTFESEFLTGNDGTVVGLLHNTEVVDVNMGTGEASFDDLTCDHLDDMIEALTTKAKRRGGRFIMSPTVFDKLTRVKDAIGNYVVSRFIEGRPPTIRGYPYVLSDQMPGVGDSAASTPFVLFGNPRHLIYGDRKGLELRVFDQTLKSVQNAQIFIRARFRAAFDCAHPTAFSRLSTAAS